MERFIQLAILSLLLTHLALPFPTVLAKGGGEDLAFSEVEASPRTYWLDASMSPQLQGCEKGSLAHTFPALYDRDPVYFDGDSTYYFRPFQCGDQVPPQALMALASFRPDLDTLIFIQKDPLTGEVFDEEVDSAWYQDMVEGFLSQMKAAVGEKRTRAILTTLGAVGAGVGLTLLAGQFALVGGVLLPVMISLGGLYLIHFYQDLLYRRDFRQMGEHLFWDVLVGGVAYGSSRAVRWVRTSPVIEQLKSTVSRVGGWISRLRTQVRYHLDKPKIDRALDEIWAQAHRPGGGDLGPASPARPSSGGGVATLTRPRVLPKTELIRKPQTKPWTLNPAELSGTRPLHTPQTSSIPSPQAAAGNLTIGDQLPETKPLKLGKAWTDQDPNGPSYEDWFQSEVVDAARESQTVAPQRIEAGGDAHALGSRSRKPGPNQLGFFQTNEFSSSLLAVRGVGPCSSYSVNEYHDLVRRYYRSKGKRSADRFQCLMPLFEALQRIMVEKSLDPLLEEQRLRGLWVYLRDHGIENREELYEKVLSSERGSRKTWSARRQVSAARKLTGTLTSLFSDPDIDIRLDTFLRAMGFEEEVKLIQSSTPVSSQKGAEQVSQESSYGVIAEFYEILIRLPHEAQTVLLNALSFLTPIHLNALVNEKLQGENFLPQVSYRQLQIEQRKYRRKVYLNLRRLTESMGMYPFFFLARSSVGPGKSAAEGLPIGRFVEQLLISDLWYGSLYDAYFAAIRLTGLRDGLSGARPVTLKKWMNEVFPRGTVFRFLHGKPQSRMILAFPPGSTSAGLFSVHLHYHKRTVSVLEALKQLLHKITGKSLPLSLGENFTNRIMEQRLRKNEKLKQLVLYVETFDSNMSVNIEEFLQGLTDTSSLTPEAARALEKLHSEEEALRTIQTHLSSHLGWNAEGKNWQPIIKEKGAS